MKHVFVIDAVEHRGQIQPLIGLTDIAFREYSDPAIFWVVRPEHQQYCPANQVAAVLERRDGYEVEVCRFISEKSQNGFAGAPFHVLTYNTKLLAAAAALSNQSLFVMTDHISNLRRLGDHGSGAAAPRSVIPDPLRVEHAAGTNQAAAQRPKSAPMAYEQRWRDLGIGSQPQMREFIFEAMKAEAERLTDGPPPTMAAYSAYVSEQSLRLAQAQSFSRTKHWKFTVECVLRAAMFGESFIRDDGTPILPGIGELASEVKRIEADFRLRTHAAMLYQLIVAGGIKTADRFSMGVALWQHGSSLSDDRLRIIAQVDEILVFLRKNNWIKEVNGHLEALPR